MRVIIVVTLLISASLAGTPGPILSQCTKTNCNNNCLQEWAGKQWSTRMTELIRRIESSPSFFYIDNAYESRELLGLGGVFSYDATKSKAYLCAQDPLFTNLYAVTPNVNANDPAVVIQNAWSLHDGEEVPCTGVSPAIDLANFKDSRTTTKRGQFRGHASGSLEINVGYHRADWAEGYDGYLSTLLLNIPGYRDSLIQNPGNLFNDPAKPILKPVIYFFADEPSEHSNFVPYFYQTILKTIRDDPNKETIIVSTGIYSSDLYASDEKFNEWIDIANQIFKEGGLVIALVGNIISDIGSPATAINAVGVGAVDLVTGSTWVHDALLGTGQGTGTTKQFGNFLKPDIQGYTDTCHLDMNGTPQPGTSTSTPTVAAVGVAMHAILKTYEDLLLYTLNSVQDKKHLNGLIAAWLLNSGTRSPQKNGNVIESGDPYNPSKTGTGLWTDPGKQFNLEQGTFFFFSSEMTDGQDFFVPLFTLPNALFPDGATKRITLKYTVYFRMKKTPLSVLRARFFEPIVILQYLKHKKTYTENDDPFEREYLQSPEGQRTQAPKWEDLKQGRKAYVTYHFEGPFDSPGTILLHVISKFTEAFYIAAYLDPKDTRVDLTYHPATPWNGGQFSLTCDGRRSNELFKQVRSQYRGGLIWLKGQPGNKNPNPPTSIPPLEDPERK